MKKIYLLLMILLLIILMSLGILSQRDNAELGIRYLKLGNTYREGGDFDKAKEYLYKGQNLASVTKSKYWQGTAKEYLGYLYRDMGIKYENLEYLKKGKEYIGDALILYTQVVRQRDGSGQAVDLVLQNIEELLSSYDDFEDMPKKGLNKVNKQEIERIIAGLKHYSNGNNEKALKEFQKALDINPDSELANFLMNLIEMEGNGDSFSTARKGGMNPKHIYTSLKETEDESPNSITKLDLNENDLKTFPTQILDFTNLESLNLSNNELNRLPEDFCQLKNLKELNLSNNDFESLPECIGKLRNLDVIYLSGNDLSTGYLLRLKDKLPNTQIIMDEEE